MPVERFGDLVEIDGKFRIEKGPRTVVAVATKELLDNNVTAGHYQVGAPDALNKEIKLGEQMTYRDWKGEFWYHVYALSIREVVYKDGNKKQEQYWHKHGEYASEIEATLKVAALQKV